jgi:hypothetical protein
MQSQWLWIMVSNAEPVVVNYAVLCLWIMASYTAAVAVKHGLLCCAGGCESWWVMLCQGCGTCCAMLSRVVVSYGVSFREIGCKSYEPVVVNHGVLCWAGGCESWCVILSQWFWIMVCYVEPMVVNHVLLCWSSGSGSWFIMLSQWFWIMVS